MTNTKVNTVRRTIKAAFMKAGGDAVLTVAEVLKAAGPGIPPQVAVQSYMRVMFLPRFEDWTSDQRTEFAVDRMRDIGLWEIPEAGTEEWDLFVHGHRAEIDNILSLAAPSIVKTVSEREALIASTPLVEKIRYGRERLVRRCLSDMAYEHEVERDGSGYRFM